jgi:hypothetical protein
MTQADRVYSTPPTNTPVDTTRRNVLVAVGGGTVAMLAATIPELAAGIPTSDPVFDLIEAHRKAEVRWVASLQELERLEKAGVNGSDVDEQPCHDAYEAFDAVVIVGATTLPGLVAKLFYLQDIASREPWMLNGRPDAAILLLEGFAASVANVWRAQS